MKLIASVEELALKPFIDTYEPSHQNGPDYILPADNKSTWILDGAVKILEVGGRPISVVTLVHQATARFENNVLLMVRRNDICKKWTGSDYLKEIKIAAKGFIKLGLDRFHGIGILGFNAPEWNISHFGAIFAGGVAAGIYTTNSAEACRHVLNDCCANIVVVENETQVQKILQVKDMLPHLKAIVQYTGTPAHPGVISWADLLRIGHTLPDQVLQKRIKSLAINQCCILIYTSGTVGNPKGVMLSHDNMTHMITYITSTSSDFALGKGTAISYLPLSHVAAMEYDLYCHLLLGTTVQYATPDALKGKLVNSLLEIRPTSMLAVPRVYEKISEKIMEAEAEMTGMKKHIFSFARKQVSNYHLKHYPKRSTSKTFMYSLAKRLVIDKLHSTIGLDKCRVYLTGAAPIPPAVHKYLLSLDMPLVEIYGLSESTGAHIMNTENWTRIGSVGRVGEFPLNEVKINEPDDKGCGEILLRGRSIFMGYLNKEMETLKVKGEDDWFHTEDVGYLDNDNFLFITGRFKEIIITSGGENVPPVIIEEKIKELLPIVSNCMVVGDKRKYLSLLITLKSEMDMDTLLSTDQLTPEAKKWCKRLGGKVNTVSDVVNDLKIGLAIQAGIDDYNNNHAISNVQKIKKWTILPLDFCIPNNELGPTAKVKRTFILTKYADVIEKMYS